MKIRNFLFAALTFLAAFGLTGCGDKVQVPPAHVGKIMTKDGYQEALIPSSSFRLAPCWAYCDKLVLLDASDKAQKESISIFIPTDQLELEVGIQITLSLNPKKVAELFGALPPQSGADGNTLLIGWAQIYNTYAQQIVLTETREYISKFSISQIASSLEKVNADLRVILQERIQERTPFMVRYVGITNIKYPDIITEAQKKTAERREQIQKEEAQGAISKVVLERELNETRLQRQIDLEKAEIEAKSQQIQRETIDEKVLALRRIENERLWIEKWNGQLPTMMPNSDSKLLLSVPQVDKK